MDPFAFSIMGLDLLCAQDFQSHNGGGIATFDSHLLKACAEVLLGGFFAHFEDGGDIAVGLALSHPDEHLRLTRGESISFLKQLRTLEIRTEAAVISEALFEGFRPSEPCLHSSEEVVPHDGFAEVVVGTEIHAHTDVVFITLGGEEDEGGVVERIVLTHSLDDPVAVEFGHHDITEDEVWALLAGDFDAYAAIFRHTSLVALQFEHERHVSAHGGLVFDDEDFLCHAADGGRFTEKCYPTKVGCRFASECIINEALTPQQVHLLRKTFAQLARHDHVSALAFYRRLFEISPELRPMFKGDIEVQSKKLIEMLGILIAMLERPHGLEIELKEMGRGISVMG